MHVRMISRKDRIVSDPGTKSTLGDDLLNVNPPTIQNPSADAEDGYIDMGRINKLDEYQYPRKK